MPLTPESFNQRLDELRTELVEQGKRARLLLDAAFDSFFTASTERAREAIVLDDKIDEVDVEIEQRATTLLTEAAREAVVLDQTPLRGILTLVKVNNEIERVADAGVDIAERTIAMSGDPVNFPPAARVMTNSTIGILRDAVRGYRQRDPALARLVLEAEDTVEQFQKQILAQSRDRVRHDRMTIEVAFDLHELTSQCMLIAAHCTNVAEQVIYESTGTIVRHTAAGWVDARTPPPDAPATSD